MIAVLITVHNHKEKTLACLNALFNCLLPDNHIIEVFLVDDNSSDGTCQVVKEQFPQVKIIMGAGNLFWNGGMRLAWKTAASQYDYDHYLWLNNDVTLYPNAIHELIMVSESEHHQKNVSGSTCATNDQNKITYGGRILKDGALVMPNGQKQHCDYFNGNIVLIPSYVYATIGTNDPIFRHALGDFDYGLRAQKSGIYSLVTPHFLGTCDEHDAFASWCNPETSLFKRLKSLYSPLGNHPVEFFRYTRRHSGIHKAIFYFFTNHLRAICPSLWKNRSIN